MPVYLSFFHGRNKPDEQLENWGFTGPLIGPVNVALTYGEFKLFPAETQEDKTMWDDYKELKCFEGLFLVQNAYYGDMEVWDSNDPKLKEEISVGRKILSWNDLGG